LDEDAAAIIERLRKTRRQSLNEVVNEALCKGLKQMTAPPHGSTTRMPTCAGKREGPLDRKSGASA